VLRACLAAARSELVWVLASTLIVMLFDCQRSRSGCAGRTSGVDASADRAGAPFATRITSVDSRSRVANQ
jgi:hypothetical protein